jgi:hypothetical protein
VSESPGMSNQPEESASQPAPHEHVVFTDLDGVEGVLVDLETKQYYRLNATASLVWRGLSAGTPLAAIVQQMTAAYDVTPEHARASVAAVIADFHARRLLRR